MPCLAVDQAAPLLLPDTVFWQGISSLVIFIGTALIAVIGTVEAFIWSRIEPRTDGPRQFNTALVSVVTAAAMICLYNLVLLATGLTVAAAVRTTVPLWGASPELIQGIFMLVLLLSVFPTVMIMIPLCGIVGRFITRRARHRALGCVLSLVLFMVTTIGINLMASLGGSGIIPDLATWGLTLWDALQGSALIGLIFFLALCLGTFWHPSNGDQSGVAPTD